MGAELSAARHLFAAIEAAIRATAPAATRAGLLATLRAQLDATTREIIERGKRRRQTLSEFERAARAAFAEQRRRAERPPQKTHGIYWRRKLM
jgi:hypothetical protein